MSDATDQPRERADADAPERDDLDSPSAPDVAGDDLDESIYDEPLGEDELDDDDDLDDEDELDDEDDDEDELDDEAAEEEERDIDLAGPARPVPQAEGPFKSGFVALVGRPNAGKSTLINAIIGHKVVITSSTAQTTRTRVSAIYNTPHMQMVLVDTPGLHKPVDVLGEELNLSALNALKDVDVVAMLVDGSAPAGRGDEWVAQHVAQADAHKILVITKADLVDQDVARRQVSSVEKYCQFDDVIVLSAKEDFNVDSFVALVSDALPEGPRWFPEDMQTDQPVEVFIAEIIREKALRNTRDEVPHSVGVMVDHTSYDEKRDLSSVYATLYVEREGQKGIMVGAGGSMIKKIGSDARRDLERFLGNRVFLKINVKVKQNWRTDASQIRRFGYGEGI